MQNQYNVINGTGIVPEGATVIDDWAFGGNKELMEIAVPKSVTIIGESAFAGCEKLRKIDLPNMIVEIGEMAFDGCGSLKDIVIPNSVRVIRDFAFRGTGLKSIVIPSSVARIGVGVFSYCPDLTRLDVEEGNPYYHSQLCDALIDTEYKILIQGCSESSLLHNASIIGKSAFCGCKDLKEIILPPVTRIEEYAFEDCSNLESVVLPRSLRVIGDYAFSDCQSLTEIIMPDEVVEIGEGAFSGCFDLKSITIPDSVKKIGKDAFRSCFSLEEIIIGDNSLLKDANVPQKKKRVNIEIIKEAQKLLSDYLQKRAEQEGIDLKLGENESK